MMTAYDWFITYLDLSGSVGVGNLWQCPAHDDSFPSLAVDAGDGGRVLINCFAGCEWQDVIDTLHLPSAILFGPHLRSPQKYLDSLAEPPEYAEFAWKSGSDSRKGEFWDKHRASSYVSEDFHYYNAHTRLRRRRDCEGRKQLLWQVQDSWRWVGSSRGMLDLSKLPVYKVELVTEARESGKAVILCESESSVDALVSAGLIATTWAGGASKPQERALVSALTGCDVICIPDNDKAGQSCLAILESFLPSVVNSWTVLAGEQGEDARDLLERGALEHLRDLM